MCVLFDIYTSTFVLDLKIQIRWGFENDLFYFFW